MGHHDGGTVAWLSNGKRNWRDCCLRTEDIANCNRATGFQIYPQPDATQLKEKLEFLKRNHLNLYADSER